MDGYISIQLLVNIEEHWKKSGFDMLFIALCKSFKIKCKLRYLLCILISHARGRVFVALANEKIAVFHRNTGKNCSWIIQY